MKIQKSIALFGAGGHAKMIADALEQDGSWKIKGFFDDEKTGDFFGYPILGDRSVMTSYKIDMIIIAIGNPKIRMEIQTLAKNAGKHLAIACHPSSVIGRDVKIGEGSVLLHNSVLGVSSSIGIGSIVNTGATVDHDCVLGDFVHVAPGVSIAGGVHIGHGSHIGIGACVKEGVSIGNSVIIGAGSVVLYDIPDNTTAYGVPARPVSA